MDKKLISDALANSIETTLSSPKISEEQRGELLRLERETLGVALRARNLIRTLIFDAVIFVLMLVLLIVGAATGNAVNITLASFAELIVVVIGILSLIWHRRAVARTQTISDRLQNELSRNRDKENPVQPNVIVFGPASSWGVVGKGVQITHDESRFTTRYPYLGAALFVPEAGNYSVQFGKKTGSFKLEDGEVAVITISIVKKAIVIGKKTLLVSPLGRTQKTEKTIAASKEASATISVPVSSAAPIDKVIIPEGRSVSTYLDRAEIFVEEREFSKANSYIEGVLDIEPKNSRAYWLKLLTSFNVTSEEELSSLPEPIDNSDCYRFIMRHGDDALKQRIASINETILLKLKKTEEERIERERIEEEERIERERAEEERLEEEKKAERVRQFEKEQLQRKERYESAIELLNGGKPQLALPIFERLGDYLDSAEYVQKIKSDLDKDMQEKKERVYLRNKDGIEPVKTRKDARLLLAKANNLLSLGDYKDAAKRGRQYKEKATSLIKKSTKKRVIIACAAIAVVGAALGTAIPLGWAYFNDFTDGYGVHYGWLNRVFTANYNKFNSGSVLSSYSIPETIHTRTVNTVHFTCRVENMVEKVLMPKSITLFTTYYTFDYSGNDARLASFEVDANNTHFHHSADGAILESSDSYVRAAPGHEFGHYAPTEALQRIYPESFFNCGKLESIMIPNGTEIMGDYVFKYSKSLSYVYIPASVQRVGSGLFVGCNSGLKVYCEAVSKPQEWSSSWNAINSSGAKAKVIWGAKKGDYPPYKSGFVK